PDLNYSLKQQSLSLNKTYELYFWLLLLPIEITKYGIKRIEIGLNKLRPTPEEAHPNKRFINNRLYKQLLQNKTLAEYVEKRKIGWEEDNELIKILYDNIVKSDIYAEYMAAPVSTYEADQMLWRRLYKKVISSSEDLASQLEDMDIYWNDDTETVLSFIDKTLKHFTEESDENQELIPMYRDDTDRTFAEDLLTAAVTEKETYTKMVVETAKNWNEERIGAMEMAILIVALAEITSFPAIPLSVSLNEYIEITKFYCKDDSKNFVNGVLDAIAAKLKKDGKLLKVAVVK
ncbi:MAG: transcription antitermination factor NusB, partial [Paludibacteraceae bacterium]|nr:transcription antitermination factor NusB [Paludibacteraceae bacterium]